jgi:2-amino-4-hydroxy-6-hydroxymethyldihydropteridine diphosphokinase
VAAGFTRLPPFELLGLLKELEAEAGRVPSATPDGPRTLDLDLLLYGGLRIDLPGLVVPHPRLMVRRFVLAPLADLLPDRLVPGTGKTVARLLEEAPPARVDRRLSPRD